MTTFNFIIFIVNACLLLNNYFQSDTDGMIVNGVAMIILRISIIGDNIIKKL